MSKDNKYWIPVLSWNLLESMTTEKYFPIWLLSEQAFRE